MHENRETSEMPAENVSRRTTGEGSGHTARMYVPEESHSGILPMNQSNKDRKPSAENEEERPLIKENAGQPNTHPTESGERVSQGLAPSRDSSIRRTQITSWRTCGSGWESLGWSSILTRRAGLSLVG